MKMILKNTQIVFQKINFLENKTKTLTDSNSAWLSVLKGVTANTSYKIRLYISDISGTPSKVTIINGHGGSFVDIAEYSVTDSGKTITVTPTYDGTIALQLKGTGTFSATINVQIWLA